MSCAVTFRIHMSATQWGESVGIVGNIDTLSCWGKTTPTSLTPSPYPFWTVTLLLTPNTAVEYKYVIIKDDKLVQWETLPSAINRKLQTGAPGTVVTIDDGSFGDDTKITITESQNTSEFESNDADTIEQSINGTNTGSSLEDELKESVQQSTVMSKIAHTTSSLVDNDQNSTSVTIEDEGESIASAQDTELKVHDSMSIIKTSKLEVLSDKLDTLNKQVEDLIPTDESHHSWNSEYDSTGWSSESISGESDEKKLLERESSTDTNSDTWSCEGLKVDGCENDENELNMTIKSKLHDESSVELVEGMTVQPVIQTRMGRLQIKGAAIVRTVLMIVGVGLMHSAALLGNH